MIKYMLFLYLLAFIGCANAEEEVYILPESYVGVVYIIFNQEKGEPPKYEAGKRVYEIPSNGILKTQFNFNEGWIGIPKYYYFDGKNTKLIPYQIENKELQTDILQVCCIQSGKSYKENNKVIQYKRFFIGTKSQIDSFYEFEQRKDISKYVE